MGTNYYIEPEPPCDKCQRPFDRRHIGKSSGGWCFSLHVYPSEGINDLYDWLPLFEKGRILDEYSHNVTAFEMLSEITCRRGAKRVDSPTYGPGDGFDYARNHAVPGPMGLIRHRLGDSVVGYGAGTWDLVTGDFS